MNELFIVEPYIQNKKIVSVEIIRKDYPRMKIMLHNMKNDILDKKKAIFGVNWSAMGTTSTEYTLKYAELLAFAAKEAEKLNA